MLKIRHQNNLQIIIVIGILKEQEIEDNGNLIKNIALIHKFKEI